MIKNIFFDFNGTLLDDVFLTFDIENQLAKKYGVPPFSMEKYLDVFCFPVRDYYEKIGFDLSKIDFNKLSHEFMDEFYKRFSKDTKLYDGLIQFLSKLKKEGYKLFVVSATKHEDLVNQLKEKEIDMFFDDFIGSNNIAGKGKIDYSKDFVNSKNINTNESVFVGDTIHDYEVGSALKMKVVLVTFGHNSEKLLKTVSSNLVSNYDELYRLIKSY